MSVITNVYNKVSTLWSVEKNQHLLIQDQEILKMGTILNGLFTTKKHIEIPRLVVVGGQSSGKSSLLNSILGMDILPTGSNMVTRSPLQIELIQSPNRTITFGDYVDGKWIKNIEYNLSLPTLSSTEKQNIVEQIEMITRKNAGNEMNITNTCIFIQIHSPTIPNLTLIDLPGLTMVACTDKGQPKDIKQQIRNVVGEYIKPSKTIILAVMPARTDIEADMALDLIKEYDPDGYRTIGILTKLDLMNENTDVSQLLENNVSIDLQMKYGYYGIRNRSKTETHDKTVAEGLELEHQYFANHSVYSNSKYSDHLGIPSLCKRLRDILITSIKTNLPILLTDLRNELRENTIQLDKLGEPIPLDETAKTTYIHTIIYQFSRKFVGILEDRGHHINTGRTMKDIFIQYRKDLLDINPFNDIEFSDTLIEHSIANCQGNHMTGTSAPIEVLEQIMKDDSIRPLYKLYEPSKKCLEAVMNEMVSLVNILIDEMGIIRFPHFSKTVRNEIVNHILMENMKSALDKIKEQMDIQHHYIWTDNTEFIDILENQRGVNNTIFMRHLLTCYYKSVIAIFQDTIPKYIMFFLVKKTEDALSSGLYEIIKKEKVDELLVEYEDIHSKRVELDTHRKALSVGIEWIEKI